MTIPYVNGVLTELRAAGSVDDYHGGGASGTARWTGSLGVYVADELVEVPSGMTVSVVTKTRVEVPHMPAGHLVQDGDWLVYTGPDDVSYTRRADAVTHAALTGRTRVMLDDL